LLLPIQDLYLIDRFSILTSGQLSTLHRRPWTMAIRPLTAPEWTCAYGIVAGDENGLVASTTNMTRAVRSPLPLLDTSIGVTGG
jgi:hypothetical protein